MNIVMKTFETRAINYTKKEHGVDFVGFADFYTDGQLRYAMNVRLRELMIDRRQTAIDADDTAVGA